MNAVMKMQRISLNLYLLDQIFHLIFSFFWPDIQINLYLRAPPTLNKIFLSGPEQRNHELWIFEWKIVFFLQWWIHINVKLPMECELQQMYKIYKTLHLLEANMADWLIYWNIFPFLWWRTSLQMSRSECKINQKLSVRSIPGKMKYFVLFLVYFEGKHRNNCECYPCLFLSVSHLLSMLQLESLSH